MLLLHLQQGKAVQKAMLLLRALGWIAVPCPRAVARVDCHACQSTTPTRCPPNPTCLPAAGGQGHLLHWRVSLLIWHGIAALNVGVHTAITQCTASYRSRTNHHPLALLHSGLYLTRMRLTQRCAN